MRTYFKNLTFQVFSIFLLIIAGCDNNTKDKTEPSSFINKLLDVFIQENPDLTKKEHIINVRILNLEKSRGVILTAYDRNLFPNIDSCYLGTYEKLNNVFVFSGYPDTILLPKISPKNKCKYSTNSIIDFEYDPITWDIWLFKNYELDPLHTMQEWTDKEFSQIMNISKYLEVDSSLIVDKNYYNEPQILIDSPAKYQYGDDSLYNFIITKTNLKKYLINDSIDTRFLIRCTIDSTGTIEAIDFPNSFVNEDLEKDLESVLIGINGFSIPTHRNFKVKTYYSVVFNK